MHRSEPANIAVSSNYSVHIELNDAYADSVTVATPHPKPGHDPKCPVAAAATIFEAL
jgi:hypothetical protein